MWDKGDPGAKPGAFLSGLPPFLRSRPEDHGLNGYGLNGYVWVLDPELPGFTGGRFGLAFEVRTWVREVEVKEQMDGEVRGVHLRTKGSWRRSTGTWSRAVGSQVRNDRRLRCPSLLLNGIGCADDPGWRPLNRVDLVRRSASGKANPVSPLTSGVAATGSSLTRSLGLDRVSTFRSSLHSGAARAHLRSRCEPQVRGVGDVASVTTSCSPGVRWTGVDLRHLSRPWAQDSFIAATITSACPWGAQGTRIAGLPDS